MSETITVEANGLRFACDTEGDGDAVALCLHGFPESRYSWRHQLPVLAQAGWRAVAPDLRGYGGTDRPIDQDAYKIQHLVKDTAALFDALGANRRLLVAHDWGAVIAWQFAIHQVRKLDGLIIMNVPHPSVFQKVLKTSAAQRKKSWYVFFFQLPFLPEWSLGRGKARSMVKIFRGMAVDKSAFPDAVIDQYRANASRPGALTAMIAYYRANFRGLMRQTKTPVVQVPTLMLWGEEDKALGLELTEGYDPYVKDFTLVRLPGVSHWVQQEAPGKVNAAMLEWLAKHHLVLSQAAAP